MEMKRRTTHGLNAATLTLIVVGILAVINFVGFRHYHRLDFTKQKSFSLAPQSIKVVKALKEEVKVTGFFKSQEKPIFDELIDKYKYHTNKLVIRFVDPDQDVATAKLYKVKRYKTIIVEKDIRPQGKKEIRIEDIGENAEEKLTNAIIKVGKEKMPIVYFTKGHEEKEIKDADREGYSVVREALEEAGYVVYDLSLLEKGEIPGDLSALIVAGPQKPFLPKEIELIETYSKSGGRVLFLVDPTDRELGLESLFQKVGVSVRRDIVVDPISTLFGQGAATPVVSQYSSHEIVRDLKLASFYPMSRSLEIKNPLPHKEIKVESIADSSPNSWGETAGLKSEKVRFDEGKDHKGPLHLALASHGKWAGGDRDMRWVIFGDSDFVNNRSFDFSGNSNIFLNSLAWLVEDETSISIRPNVAGTGKFVMTPQQIRIVFLLTVVFVPLAIVGSGIFVWLSRRKLA